VVDVGVDVDVCVISRYKSCSSWCRIADGNCE
jgi:hypothetical protein